MVSADLRPRYNSGQKCTKPSHGGSMLLGLSAGAAVPSLASVGQVEEEAAAAAALGQRKKLLLPSSTTFSSGSKPVCSQDSHHVNGREG